MTFPKEIVQYTPPSEHSVINMLQGCSASVWAPELLHKGDERQNLSINLNLSADIKKLKFRENSQNFVPKTLFNVMKCS